MNPNPSALDPNRYLSLRDLSHHCGLSVRTLRRHMADPIHPLPVYRLSAGKVLCKLDEFNSWCAARNQRRRPALDEIVDSVVRDLRR